MRSADTSPEAYSRQIEVYRSMSPERRLAIGVRLSEEAFDIVAAGIEARHPDYTPAQVDSALRRIRLGDELFRQVWPSAALMAP